ncbi:MAG TPA: hypothetical protein VGM88_29720 [Kofleriaceae bacterium]|jgi:hypothetical protein
MRIAPLVLVVFAACAPSEDHGPPLAATYAISRIDLPTDADADEFGFDAGGTGSARDNTFGLALALVSGYFGVDMDAATRDALASGDIAVTVAISTDSTENSDAAVLQIGDARIAGTITDGLFSGSGGTFPLPFAIADGNVLAPLLVDAQVRADGITADGIADLAIAGIFDARYLETDVAPALAQLLQGLVARDCTGPSTFASECGCTNDSPGLSATQVLDTNMDCTITADEILANQQYQSIFVPDICTLSGGCPGNDAMSFGVHAVAQGQ